jgi:methylated-DNA-protein-cysteine methyltransferase related protein
MNPFHTRVIETIRNIPAGRVCTYGLIAALAGNPRGARTVSWILHSSSGKFDLPWHRVINSRGTISLLPGNGFEVQKQLLIDEGVLFNAESKIDLKLFLWQPNELEEPHSE